MPEGYVLSLDQGTTSSRAIVFDRSGRIIAQSGREFRQIFPRAGWVEHDPDDIWTSQLETAREALRMAGTGASEIAALGITNQRETTLVWERATGRPVCNAIVWQDRRTAPMCDDLRARGPEPLFRERTGLVLDPYFSGTKLRWILDNVPGARERAEGGDLLFGTVDTYLIWRLTGARVHVTDVSNASRTLLFNIHTLAWDDELLDALGVPATMLPQVRGSSEVYGETEPDLLGGAIAVAGAAGDQQAATFGQACFAPGMVKNTYGTGCFLLMNTGERPVASRSGLLTTVGWRVGGRTTYCLEGSVFVAGAAVQYLRDSLGIIASAPETESLARSVDSTGGVYFVPAFAGLGAPYWDPYARAAILGLTRGTGKAEIARAALEAVAYQTRDVVDAMAQDSGQPLSELRVDGGMVANDFLMQFQADVLGVPILRPEVSETTALGAAYLAGLAVAYWGGEDDIARNWRAGRTFTPQMDPVEAGHLYARWQAAVERVRGWAIEGD
jgi:glycerol kinase